MLNEPAGTEASATPGQPPGLTGSARPVFPPSPLQLFFFHGCGTQNQNFADRQHPGVRGDHPVLGVLQDPGPIRGAHPAGAPLRPEAESQEWQSFQLGGQAVNSSATGEAGGCGVQPAKR